MKIFILFSVVLLLYGCYDIPNSMKNEPEFVFRNEYGYFSSDINSGNDNFSILFDAPFPNPTLFNLVMNFKMFPKANSCLVKIFDIDNNFILKHSIPYFIGIVSLNLSIKNLPSGIYKAQYQFDSSMSEYLFQVSSKPKVSNDVKKTIDKYFSLDRFKKYRDFIINSNCELICWNGDPFSMNRVLQKIESGSDEYYCLVVKYNQFVQGWNDVTPNMIDDNFLYIHNQNFETIYDYRFKGFAIDSITASDIKIDTFWMYYDSKNLPKLMGESKIQDSLRNILKL